MASSRFFGNAKFCKIIMHCELSIFRMFSHDKIQSYNRAYKQNTKRESNRLEVISNIECYKDFHLYDKFYFPQLIQEPNPIVKKALAKFSEFLLIRADKIMLSFMTLGMDLVMMSDKKGML